jgi:16S rRNA G966 N2-methylase RsmD
LNVSLLNKEIQDFINSNIKEPATNILLRKNSFQDVSPIEIAEQLEAKQRSGKKLPTWYNHPNIYYPNKLNIEQTSSELTASYKSKLILGTSLLDLTGGFGVDCYYFSQSFKKVQYCEENIELSKIVEHNFRQLQTDNVRFHGGDGLSFLRSSKVQFDWIYIDPSRRSDENQKVFFLSDSIPDVTNELDLLFVHSTNILIKTSPMLDISKAISELEAVKEIHIVSIKNEVKELLFILKKGFDGDICVKTINIQRPSDQVYSFKLPQEQKAVSTLGEINNFLYEPNSSILKSGAFKLISDRLKTDKIHRHSHLYTSETLKSFPGRRFKVVKVLPYNKRVLKKEIQRKKCNISARNFPEKISQLKKRFQIKDGGDEYIFFTTDMHDEKIVIITQKV